MSEEKPPVTLRSTITATFAGIFRGTDPSIVFLALFALLGVIVCTSLTIWTPWGGLGTICFLLFFLYILVCWRRGSRERSSLDVPALELKVRTGEDELALSVPAGEQIDNAKRLLGHLRKIVQARQIPPAPKGEVLGTPADEKSLREYSPEERLKVQQQWADDIPRHDHEIIHQVTSSIKQLDELTAAPTSTKDHALHQAATEQRQQESALSDSIVAQPPS